jgi:hypothetical protein
MNTIKEIISINDAELVSEEEQNERRALATFGQRRVYYIPSTTAASRELTQFKLTFSSFFSPSFPSSFRSKAFQAHQPPGMSSTARVAGSSVGTCLTI